jgi:uncharacterized membrane protein
VGEYFGPGPTNGFLYNAGVFSTISFPGSGVTYAGGINNSGQILGFYIGASGDVHGFVDNGGVYSSIDVPGAAQTIAQRINDSGQIVGYYVDASGTHGFLDNGGIFSAIDVPGVSYTAARGINNRGQIVGATLSDGFLYTPSTIPEPPSIALLSFAMVFLAIAARRRTRVSMVQKLQTQTSVSPAPRNLH